MIVTRQKLIDLARREAQKRAAGGDVLSGYVIGTVASGEPLLGGTADIDLVLIHEAEPLLEREVLALSPDIHLDIVHHGRALYAQPRQLRVHPWLGPAVSAPVFVHDPEHFFEWAQAGARGQFFRPDHTLVRARSLLESARARLPSSSPGPLDLKTFLAALQETANAAASLAGPPAAGRRLVLELERRFQTLDRPEMLQTFQRLAGASDGRPAPGLIGAWAQAFDEAARLSSDPRLAPPRRAYHLAGFQALAEAGRPDAVIFPLMIVWDRVQRALEAYGRAADYRPAWQDALQRLGLSEEMLPARYSELETYLDSVETLIDEWAAHSGA